MLVSLVRSVNSFPSFGTDESGVQVLLVHRSPPQVRPEPQDRPKPAKKDHIEDALGCRSGIEVEPPP